MKPIDKMVHPEWEDVYSRERRIAELEIKLVGAEIERDHYCGLAHKYTVWLNVRDNAGDELTKSTETLIRIARLSQEKGSPQWLRAEIRDYLEQ